MGKRVIVAGLDMDFKGRPFGPMPGLMAIAEYVTKVHAICVNCGSHANHSQRISSSDRLVELGELKEYQPLCRACFNTNVMNKMNYTIESIADFCGGKAHIAFPGSKVGRINTDHRILKRDDALFAALKGARFDGHDFNS